MTNHPHRGRIPRPLQYLHEAARQYPNAWQQIDIFRTADDLPKWPDWCFLPMAAWYSIVSADLQVDRIALPMVGDVARLAALGAWRYTQGIYRLDPDLMTAVAETIPEGSLPTDVLLHMPEWSLYIETPDRQWLGDEIHGFWAHLEFDINKKRNELRLLLDTETSLIPVPIHLGNWTITEAIDRAVAESQKQSDLRGLSFKTPAGLIEQMSASLYPLISLLLYVCSNGVDYPNNQRPGYATPKRTKKGWKLFPAAKPHIWRLGEKTGNAIRTTQSGQVDKTGKGKAPHIRRAHWHGFWSGPRDGEQRFDLQWLPPTVVAADHD